MSLRNLDILAVDDDRVTLELLTLMLEEYTSGRVIAMDDSNLAVDVIADPEQRFDLVISDLMMPDKTGLDLLAVLRARDTAIPFILLTANTRRESVIKAKQLGATAFIAKPFSTQNLLDKLDDIFSSGVE
ncbi:response regulator [Alteromonas flava]|uniref:response regulator n=1 Tax=Alteromonas flava TaxID=2048003 RepID=UPI000C2943C6|nr:response regulator [Alteromonas flava]